MAQNEGTPRSSNRRQARDPASGNTVKLESATASLLAERPSLKGHLLAEILDTADDAIVSVDSDQRIILFNRGAERIFGYDAHDVLSQPLDILLPHSFARVHRQHVRDFAQWNVESRQMGERGEISGRRKDGTEFPAEASISKVDLEGRQVFTVILRDISVRKAAEQEIKSALHEKEILLKEIHHRVKNNLQVVTSLLSLQSRGVPDEETRRLFRESQNRIQSMALIHEQLHEARVFSRIDVATYFRQLVAYLFRAYGVSSSRVRLTMEVEEVDLGVDAAVPCGLIVNELVSNSLKYAFPEGRRGEIWVNFQRGPGAPLLLRAADNGVGFPEDVDFWNTRTLGLRLVRTLANQIVGQIEADVSGGTDVKIAFSLVPETRQE